jgi:hypothetical protein
MDATVVVIDSGNANRLSNAQNGQERLQLSTTRQTTIIIVSTENSPVAGREDEFHPGLLIPRWQDPNKAAEIEVWLEQVAEPTMY